MKLNFLRLIWTMLTQFFRPRPIPIPVPSPVAIQPPVPVPGPVAIQPSFDQPTFLPTSRMNPNVTVSNLPITTVAIQPSFAQPTFLPTSKVNPSVPVSNLPITIITPSPSDMSPITIAPLSPSSCTIRPNSTFSPGFVVGKKGFGITSRSIDYIAKLLSLDVYWNYGWTLNRTIYQLSIPMFIPMVWGGRRSLFEFEQSVLNYPNLQSFLDNGTIQYLMGFNEPDQEKQSNLTVTAAIEYWPVLEKFNIPLVSPSCAKPTGEWMIEFMKIANQKCYRIDYIGIHWYGGINPVGFILAMTRYYTMYQLPLVLTEFSPADWSATNINNNRYSQTQILIFMKQVLPWLENTTWIAGYSWFNWNITSPNGGRSALFDENGNLTKLGLYYKSVRTDNIMGDQSIV